MVSNIDSVKKRSPKSASTQQQHQQQQQQTKSMKLRSDDEPKRDQKTTRLDKYSSVLLLNSKLTPEDMTSSSSSSEDDEETENNTASSSKLARADSKSSSSSSSLKKDYKNIALLMFLYFLQGIPLGLTGSLPFILSSRKVSYADQGTFSFAFWPFSLKLLWAPIVDAVFVKRIGRRKSWLVPIQYLLGAFMLLFSSYIREILDASHHNSHSDIFVLTSIFFMFTFLAATQDIAVDGWALTMLSKENVSWGSTSNSVGQTAGWFVGNVIFLAIESADFSNNYIRPFFGLASQTYGVAPIDKFMNFFGLVFLISTTLVLIFKKEVEEHHDDDNDLGAQDDYKRSDKKRNKHEKEKLEENLTVKQTYKLMWNLVWLPAVKTIILIMMTVKIAYAVESMSYLKMIEADVPKEKLTLLAVPLTPIQIILPLVLSKYTNGPRPFNLYIRAIPFRLVVGVIIAVFVYITPMFKGPDNQYSLLFYMLCLIINSLHSVFVYAMFVSQMAFYSKISDKKIGGTYMTFLNTITNMGGNWPSTCVLYLADWITVKQCTYEPANNLNEKSTTLNTTTLEQIALNKCGSDIDTKACEDLGAKCVTQVDSYYILVVACTIIGILWYAYFKRVLHNLQVLPHTVWKLKRSQIK